MLVFELFCVLFTISPQQSISTFFPYTTLFRSLTALDAKTGKELWTTTVVDYKEGAVITSPPVIAKKNVRSEEHTSELQSLTNLVCRLLLEKKKIRVK